MSQSDRRKLSDWAELLHQTSGAVRPQCSVATAAALGLTSESVAAAQGSGTDLSKCTNVMLDLAVLTAICDMNRVIFMKFPPYSVFKWDGINHTKDAGSLARRVGSALMGGACVPGVIEMLHEIDDWYAKKFAYLVGRLDSIGEGDTTFLDNTATVWFQECSDGCSNNLNNLPILQAGSCGGYFKVGQAVNVEDGRPDMTRGNSEAVCGPGDTEFSSTQVDSTGTPPEIANAPINKYYCNLMNAIGVKAGPDGFPKVGGTQEVTHFGKYDDTKLFADPESPPLIKDPGEYKALRANL
jgi:hypothetical protein